MYDQFANMEDLLQAALTQNRLNYYAYVLSRARSDNPTAKTIELTLQLIYTQGAKWIDALERQAVRNYELAFSICRDHYAIYPSLVNLAHPISNQQILQYLQNKTFEMLSNQTSTADARVMWCTFVELITRYCQSPNEQDKINLLDHIEAALRANPHLFDSLQSLNSLRVGQELALTIYSITSYKVLLAVARLYKSCCKVFRKRMSYLLKNAAHFNLISWIRSKYEDIFTKMPTFLRERERDNEAEDFQTDLLRCLIELEELVEVEELTIRHCESIVSIVCRWSLLQNLPNSQLEDKLNWEYGLILKEYGDDLPSYVAKTTTLLAKVLPGFLRTYTLHLNSRFLPEDELMMRTAVVHRELLRRPDLIEEFLQPFIQKIMATLQPYTQDINSQMDFCRKVRVLMLFSEILKEKDFQRLLDCALTMIRNEQYTSFCFLEGYNILKTVNERSNAPASQGSLGRTAQLIKSQASHLISSTINIATEVYQKFPLDAHSQEREGKLHKIFLLLEELLSQNQKVVEAIVPEILKRFCEWTVEEAYANWRRAVKSTEVLNLLIRITKLSIMLVKEDYYCDLSEPIYHLLDLLKNHNIRDYDEDLLEILAFVIKLQQEISLPMCSILSEIGRVVNYRESISCIHNVIKALCSERVASDMLYRWPDLCLHFFNLFVEHINRASQSYISYYPREWEEVLSLFGTYLQIYEQFLEQNQQARNNILFSLQSIKQEEFRLQLFIIMDQQRSVEPYQFYSFSEVPKMTHRNTFKLLFIHYCKRLRIRYSQSLLSELLQVHQIFREKQSKRALQSDIFDDWPCLRTSSQILINEMLQELRKKGEIDSMELSMYKREFDLIY